MHYRILLLSALMAINLAGSCGGDGDKKPEEAPAPTPTGKTENEKKIEAAIAAFRSGQDLKLKLGGWSTLVNKYTTEWGGSSSDLNIQDDKNNEVKALWEKHADAKTQLSAYLKDLKDNAKTLDPKAVDGGLIVLGKLYVEVERLANIKALVAAFDKKYATMAAKVSFKKDAQADPHTIDDTKLGGFGTDKKKTSDQVKDDIKQMMGQRKQNQKVAKFIEDEVTAKAKTLSETSVRYVLDWLRELVSKEKQAEIIDQEFKGAVGEMKNGAGEEIKADLLKNIVVGIVPMPQSDVKLAGYFKKYSPTKGSKVSAYLTTLSKSDKLNANERKIAVAVIVERAKMCMNLNSLQKYLEGKKGDIGGDGKLAAAKVIIEAAREKLVSGNKPDAIDKVITGIRAIEDITLEEVGALRTNAKLIKENSIKLALDRRGTL